jgi:hypothetical protein
LKKAPVLSRGFSDLTTTKATADPYGMTNKRTGNGKNNSKGEKDRHKDKATADPYGMTNKRTGNGKSNSYCFFIFSAGELRGGGC